MAPRLHASVPERCGVTRSPSRCAALLALLGLSAMGSLAAGCDSTPQAPAPSSSRGTPKTPDRLAPGELAEGKSALFGLKLPVGMQVEARFPQSAHASGIVSAERLANYVRQRVEVARVELAASGTVFPQASIRGGDPTRRYQIEISSKGRATKLSLHWLNPPRPPPVTGLSEEQRWQRAGISPDGKLIGQQALE
ncbi:MAG TPA: hypothetical protein VFU02_06085 [Polyangiaceae bacterium]|nr:hypothetical protein [Polyangiaceae bacterium]